MLLHAPRFVGASSAPAAPLPPQRHATRARAYEALPQRHRVGRRVAACGTAPSRCWGCSRRCVGMITLQHTAQSILSHTAPHHAALRCSRAHHAGKCARSFLRREQVVVCVVGALLLTWPDARSLPRPGKLPTFSTPGAVHQQRAALLARAVVRGRRPPRRRHFTTARPRGAQESHRRAATHSPALAHYAGPSLRAFGVCVRDRRASARCWRHRRRAGGRPADACGCTHPQRLPQSAAGRTAAAHAAAAKCRLPGGAPAPRTCTPSLLPPLVSARVHAHRCRSYH
jgi:hypothetical protein